MKKRQQKKRSRKKSTRRKKPARTLSSKSRIIYRQCYVCGGLVEQKWSTGDNSFCPLCGQWGTIIEEIGEIPDPQLHGSWLYEQQQKEEAENPNKKLASEFTEFAHLFQTPDQAPKLAADKKVKIKKQHSGVYSCLDCCIEFDLLLDWNLQCDECGGPLMSGTLDDYWVEDDEPID